MTSIFLFKNLLGTLLLPPTNGLLPLLVAALFRRRRWAFGLALIGGTLLFLQSLPIVASNLVAPLEARAGGVFVSAQGARAMIAARLRKTPLRHRCCTAKMARINQET